MRSLTVDLFNNNLQMFQANADTILFWVRLWTNTSTRLGVQKVVVNAPVASATPGFLSRESMFGLAICHAYDGRQPSDSMALAYVPFVRTKWVELLKDFLFPFCNGFLFCPFLIAVAAFLKLETAHACHFYGILQHFRAFLRHFAARSCHSTEFAGLWFISGWRTGFGCIYMYL